MIINKNLQESAYSLCNHILTSFVLSRLVYLKNGLGEHLAQVRLTRQQAFGIDLQEFYNQLKQDQMRPWHVPQQIQKLFVDVLRIDEKVNVSRWY